VRQLRITEGRAAQIVLADPDIVPIGRAASIFRLPIEDV
jgi:hypothetical protein